MDTETLFTYGFMLFGLAFFIFVTNMVNRQHDADENRRIMERREFGRREPKNRSQRQKDRKASKK